MKYILVIATLLMVVGCGERVPLPSEASLYKVAVVAVKEHEQLPPSAEVGSKRDSEFYIGKSGATIVIPYTATDGNVGSFSVWLADMHHSWIVTRCIPTPGQASRITGQ